MSFEKKMKKRGNQKLNAFAKNPYHQEEKVKPFPAWGKILIPSLVAACSAVIIVAVGIVPLISSSGKNAAHLQDGSFNKGGYHAEAASQNLDNSAYTPIKSTPGDYSYTPEEAQASNGAPKDTAWEDRSIISQYPYVKYLENTYHAHSLDKAAPIDTKYVGEKVLDDVIVDGSDNKHTIKASIYYIKNINFKAGIAVQFAGDTDYYAYIPLQYRAETFGQMYEELSFATELVIDSVTYTDEGGVLHNSHVNNQEGLINLLYSCKDLNNIYPDDPFTKDNVEDLELHISIPCLDVKSAKIDLYNYGLLSTARLEFGFPHSFNMGEGKFNEFKAAALEAIK